MEMTVWLSKYRLEYSSVFPCLWEFINSRISVILQFQSNRKGKAGAEGVVQLVERLLRVLFAWVSDPAALVVGYGGGGCMLWPSF